MHRIVNSRRLAASIAQNVSEEGDRVFILLTPYSCGNPQTQDVEASKSGSESLSYISENSQMNDRLFGLVQQSPGLSSTHVAMLKGKGTFKGRKRYTPEGYLLPTELSEVENRNLLNHPFWR